jgi:hypothetical protein
MYSATPQISLNFVMANGSTDEKQHAHELIDRMAPGQVAVVVDHA